MISRRCACMCCVCLSLVVCLCAFKPKPPFPFKIYQTSKAVDVFHLTSTEQAELNHLRAQKMSPCFPAAPGANKPSLPLMICSKLALVFSDLEEYPWCLFSLCNMVSIVLDQLPSRAQHESSEFSIIGSHLCVFNCITGNRVFPWFSALLILSYAITP